MAKRSVRRRRRMAELNKHTPHVEECFADDCTETATTTVDIDGQQYRVCAGHAEAVMIQEGRRQAEAKRQEDAAGRRRATEEALGLR